MKRTEITRENMEAAERLLRTAAIDHAELYLAVGLGPAGPEGKRRPVLYLLRPGLTFERADSLMAHLVEAGRDGQRSQEGRGGDPPDWWLEGGPPPVPDGGKGGGG